MEESRTVTRISQTEDRDSFSENEKTNDTDVGFPLVLDKRFTYLDYLGHGGFGKIFLAYDNYLQRKVALKFLRNVGPSNSKNILAEARAQAQIKHDNICQIFEINESHNQAFLVMQYVDGTPIRTLAKELTTRNKLSLVADVISGLSCAHKNGVIHGDIKPDNILVERLRSGMYKAYLIDFGGAKWENNNERNCADKNSANKNTGTPSYMSPEQKKSQQLNIDRRTDIFSIGATLFKLLTGKSYSYAGIQNSVLMFENSLDKAQVGKLKPESTQVMPKDLQCLILKCTKFIPEERYQTADEIGADLRRYLQGEPISVYNRAGYRVLKKIRQRSRMVKFLGIALVALTIGIIWLNQTFEHQVVRENLVQDLAEKVESLESNIRYSYMSPMHDLSEDVKRWHKTVDEIVNETKANDDSLVKGATLFAIGRINYSFQNYDVANQYLLESWESGFRQKRVAYMLAMSYGAIYQKQRYSVENIINEEARNDQLDELDKSFRQPAIDYLKLGLSAAPDRSYAKALLAFYQGDNDKALKILKGNSDVPNWFYEYNVLEGDIYLALAESSLASNNDVEVNIFLNKALALYQQAMKIAPSDFHLSLKPVNIIFAKLKNHLYGRTGEFEVDFDLAKQYIYNSQSIVPESHQTYFLLGSLLSLKSENSAQFNGEPLLEIEQAIAQYQLAVEKSPKQNNVLRALGFAYVKKMKIKLEKKLDAENEFLLATSTLSKVEERARDYHYYNSLGSLLRTQAENSVRRTSEQPQQESGLPAITKRYTDSQKFKIGNSLSDRLFEQSVEAYQMASSLRPERIGAILNAGSVYRVWSYHTGIKSAEEKLEEAIKEYQKALKLNKGHFVANYYLGASYRRLAFIQGLQFKSVSKQLEISQFYLDSALASNPGHPFIINELALLESERATIRWQLGKSPSLLFKKASTNLETVLSNYEKNQTLLATRADIHMMIYITNWFSNSNEDTQEYTKIVEQSLVLSDYNLVDLLMLKTLSGKLSLHDAKLMESLDKNRARVQLLKGVHYFMQSKYDLAELSFNNAEQSRRSFLLLFRHKNLTHWLNHLNSQSKEYELVSQMLMVLENQLATNYPELNYLINDRQ